MPSMSGTRIQIKEVYLYNANTGFMVEGIFTLMGIAGCIILALAIIAFIAYWAFMGLMFIVGVLLLLWERINKK